MLSGVFPKKTPPGTPLKTPRELENRRKHMKKIGILFGIENSFPSALAQRINARHADGIRAEFVLTGAVRLDRGPRYAVILDRISHEIPFYRAFLMHAALHGVAVINNPFWQSADNKFFNYALAAQLGVAVPPTVLLPHKEHPGETTARSMRNLEFPLDWDGVFAYVGEHGFLKPMNGGGWRGVQQVHNREEFFHAYDRSRDLCMIYQKAVPFTEYYRCFVVGQKNVRTMPYDPRRPRAGRYLSADPRGAASKKLLQRIEQDALTLCRALGYDLNTVEFAVEHGVPYAIDFMNPVPDADLHSVGDAHFEWIVDRVADLLIAKARQAPQPPELRWSAFMGAGPSAARTPAAAKKASPPKQPAQRAVAKARTTRSKRTSKLAAEEERAAANDEPMGSIAAAVPGSDALAEDAIENAELPGAEEPEVAAQPETTAGTEFGRDQKITGKTKGSI